MREPFVIAGADYRQIVSTLGGVRKQIRYFNAGLTVFLKRPSGRQKVSIPKLTILKVCVSKALGRMLAIQFAEQGLWVESVHVTRPALHEERDHALCRPWEVRRLRCERIR